MTPGDLQAQLTSYYELSLPLGVEAVLTCDRPWRDGLLAAGAPRPREQLLLRQDDEGVDLALYLDSAVLDVLAQDDPRERMHEGNLPALLAALEGVSHFVCVTWHAQHRRAISALELELQAEVDKFLVCVALTGADHAGVLLMRLFDGVRFDPALDAEARSRYAAANRLAARYCLDLLRRHEGRLQGDRARRELRRFYRLSRSGKFAAIG